MLAKQNDPGIFKRARCGFPMCEECSKKYNGIYNFCPHHYALLDEIKPTEEMEKFRNGYYTKEVFGK